MGGAHEDEVVRKVKTKKALFKLLDAIEGGRAEEARLDLPPGRLPPRQVLESRSSIAPCWTSSTTA